MNPLLAALVASGVLTQAEADRIARQLDPDAARLHSERVLIDSFRNGLSAQQRRILGLLNDTQGQPTARQLALLWEGEDALLWASVGDDIRSIALERAVSASIGLGDVNTWELVNEEVLAWVDDYYLDADGASYGSIPNLNKTSQTEFARAFTSWQRGELEAAGYNDGLPELIRSLTPVFGASRAERISITETTRIFSESELAAGNANPFVAGWVYNTANDSVVSDLCRPAANSVMLKGESTFPDGLGPPPRHVRCRSSISAISGPALAQLRADRLVNSA
jgi:hypothetical protein